MRPAARPLWPLLGVAGLWLPLMARWSRAWAQAPDQAFGWGVPVLAGYLLAIRWQSAQRVGDNAFHPGREPVAATAAFVFGCLLVLTDLPVLEANALWPTAQYWGAAGAALATLAALAAAGGLRWALQFVFPPLFIFTALTWPTIVKTWVVGTLAGVNAQLAASVVSAAGHPAVVSGNVIAVRTGLVGIEEACSGLRSLQTVWMVAWFAGEFFRLNLPRRFFLVLLSLAIALAANLGRTIFLTWIAAAQGLGLSERWHDRAGNLELALDLILVTAMAWRAFQGQRRRRVSSAPVTTGRELAKGSAASRIAASAGGTGLNPPLAGLDRWAIGARLGGFGVAALLVGIAAEICTQEWYGSHARATGDALVHWRLQSPSAAWHAEPVPARELAALQSTSAAGLSVRPPASPYAAWVFVVNWEGDAARSENPEWHDPAICLPAAGGRLVAQLGTAPVGIGGRILQFAGYRFEAGGQTETVYFCHWDAETARARAESSGSAADVRTRRWQRVAEGRREGDVAHLAFVVETGDSALALEWLRRWAPLLLRPGAG